MRGILHVVSVAVAGLVGLIILPIVIAIADGERDLALQMILTGALIFFAACGVLAAISGFQRRLGRAEGYAALIIVWIMTPIVGAITFSTLTTQSFMDGWFEAVSALTTSGVTLLSRETEPRAILFWRAMMEWYGGFLTLVSIIHVLAPGGFGGLPGGDRRLLASSGDDFLGDLHALRQIAGQYLLITGLVFTALVIAGVDGSVAAMLGMVSVATGGFLPFEGALENHAGPAAQIVLAIGLGIGTVSVFWRRQLMRGPARFFRDNMEALIVAGIICILTLAYTSRLATVSGGRPDAAMFAEGLLAGVSLVATSGIESRPGVIALLPDVIVLVVVLAGAGIYSTTGGIKIYRIGAMAAHATRELNRLIYPSISGSMRFGSHILDEESLRAVWSAVILSLLVITVGAFFFTLEAADFEAGLALSIALFSNAGPVYEAVTPAIYSTDPSNDIWPAISELPLITKLAGIVIMTFGRLEVLIVFAVFNVRYWLTR